MPTLASARACRKGFEQDHQEAPRRQRARNNLVHRLRFEDDVLPIAALQDTANRTKESRRLGPKQAHLGFAIVHLGIFPDFRGQNFIARHQYLFYSS